MIRDLDWHAIGEKYLYNTPFRHIVIDNFFIPEVAEKLSAEFPDFDDPNLVSYNNPLENKRVMNRWDMFPSTTYRAFSYFGRPDFIENLKIMSKEHVLWYDFGLHGGGWHMHGRNGNNNVHLDYNLHPKLNLQRKINIIVYLTPNWNPSWGGGLELWTQGYTRRPFACEKKVDNLFNRAIIFDTTQNSWHGLPTPISCPEGVVRKSIAAYFIRPAPEVTEQRGRALFSAREDQAQDKEILELIEKRSDVSKSKDVYKYTEKK